MTKHFSTPCLLALFALPWLVLAGEAIAADVQLKASCHPAGSLLVLGDVAEILSTDTNEAQRLASTPLMPAPAPGAKKYLRGREIQDILVARGVNVGELNFSGASQVVVETVVIVEPVEKPAARGPVVPPLQLVNEALLRRLQAVSGGGDWNFQFQLSTATQQALRRIHGPLQVAGGESPWTGAQHFTLVIPTADGPVEQPLTVEVSTPHAVVAVARALPRGSILRADDLKLVEPASHEHVVRAEEAFRDVEQVIGKETQRAISPGQILDKNYVRAPILVRRGDVVTVYARAAGIRVRTAARALMDGGAGDLIAVETLETGRRDKFDARVTGAQVVEVWAGSIGGVK